MDSPGNTSIARKRRGVPQGSLTHLTNKLKELEASHARDPVHTVIAARQLLKKVESVDAEFKRLHLALIDLLSADGDLWKEQDVLDEHEVLVDDLNT